MNQHTSKLQNTCRIILGAFMLLAGTAHLTYNRETFQAQVPNWIPISKDLTVILSGVVEISLGAAMIFWKKERVKVGIALAIFYVLIFPGNISQYVNKVDAFGLDTDSKRLARLFFQPVLIIIALWSTGALKSLTRKSR